MLKKKREKKGPRKWTNKPCFQGVQHINTTIFPGGSLCHSQYILEISWKSIYLFVHDIANRHTAAPRWETVKQSSQVWNSLSVYFLCRARYIMKIWWGSIHENVSDCSLSHVQSFLKISWKSVHPFSRNVASRHGFPWKKKDLKNYIVELYTSMYLRSSIEGVKHNTPNFFSDCSLDLSLPSLKIS